MQKELDAQNLISLVRSFLEYKFSGEISIKLDDVVGFNKDEFQKLITGGKLVEKFGDDAYIYATYRYSNGLRLKVVYHKENGVYWVPEVTLERVQDN